MAFTPQYPLSPAKEIPLTNEKPDLVALMSLIRMSLDEKDLYTVWDRISKLRETNKLTKVEYDELKDMVFSKFKNLKVPSSGIIKS